ncbi:sulfatase family protein [Parapedobacter sp. 10938]|uniref:sulfatase family protein n=1 Tax=Parapedobacter flavus TaxID=3110225 RepID=UPI002DBD904F|nr:sulfatase [Parapedobacter sp. 10938]MEC3878176.1 sulfatase [Parapedobacter sp. 10938]
MKVPFERAIWLTILLTTVALTPRAQEPGRPNFVLYITDDVGWGDIGCYGSPTVKTPHIDALAAKGLQFENTYLTTSSCSPSRSSLITGRYPHNTGAPELHDPLPPGQVMFPQLLKTSGYYTVLSGKNHMGPQTKHAFDYISSGKGPGGQEDWVSIIRNRPKDQPFFFWFASHDAHRGWQINDKGTIYDPEDIAVPPMLYDGPVTRSDLANYYHEVSRADYYLGELIQELDRQDLLDNTYIIFMSDNGSPFPRNKSRLYDSGIKTPFIVYGPNVAVGRNHALVSTLDIAPTLLDLAGVAASDRMQGRSFRPVLENNLKKGYRDFVFAEHNWHVFQAHERMVRYQDWVYIRNAYPDRGNYAGESTRQFPAGEELWDAYDQGRTTAQQEDVFLEPRPSEELYNINIDSFQFVNLADQRRHRKILVYLRGVMDQWVEETGDSVPEEPTPDRDDIYGKRLPGNWEKGEKPGASKNAGKIKESGPITVGDIQF